MATGLWPPIAAGILGFVTLILAVMKVFARYGKEEENTMHYSIFPQVSS